MPISSLFRFIKIRLEIMLKDFADKKETFLDYKKQNFQNFLVRKLPIFSLFVFGQNKTRNNT